MIGNGEVEVLGELRYDRLIQLRSGDVADGGFVRRLLRVDMGDHGQEEVRGQAGVGQGALADWCCERMSYIDILASRGI